MTMRGVNEDAYWMQVQAQVERWDLEDDFFEDDEDQNEFSELDAVDMEVDEMILERGRNC